MAIHVSPRYVLLLLLVHLFSALAVYAASLPPFTKLAILFLLLISLIHHLARDALLLLPASWRNLSLSDGVATIVHRDGTELIGQCADGCVVTPWFVILRIKPEGRCCAAARVILPDALERDAFRELCVRLRFFQRD